MKESGDREVVLHGDWVRRWGLIDEGFYTSYLHGVDRDMLLEQSLLSPATFCLINPDGARTVEAAFAVTDELSRRLRREHGFEDSPAEGRTTS